MAKRSIRNIGVIAHIDAGKTTVSEHMLYYSHKEHRIGVVHKGTATLDFKAWERERGITVSAAVTTFDWNDYQVNLIDTPGHVDFTAEVERSLRVLDGAVCVFCGKGGVEAQSETVWRQADTYKVPRVAFVNKLDSVGSDFSRVVEAICSELGANAVAAQVPIGSENGFAGVIDLVEPRALRFGPPDGEDVLVEDVPEELADRVAMSREKLVEAAAEFDDELMEAYIEGRDIGAEQLRAAIRAGTLLGELVPVFAGAAFKHQGVQPLLDAVCYYLPAPDDLGEVEGINPHTGKETSWDRIADESFCALAFKTEADQHGELVHIRVYSGRLKAGDQVLNSRTAKKDRAQMLYSMHADERIKIEEAVAGSIVAVVGFRNTATGDTVCDPSSGIVLPSPKFPDGVVTMVVEPIEHSDRDKLIEVLTRFEREDPTFNWEEKDQQLVISGMGELHLEIIKDRLERDFNVKVKFGPPRVSYRVRIAEDCAGKGEFERKVGERSQYAEISISIEPNPEENDCEIINRLSKDDVPLEFHPAVQESLEAEVLSVGYNSLRLMKTRVIVTGGATRQGEATEVAFRSASKDAMEHATGLARLVFLQPMCRFEIPVPEEYYGAVSNDLSQRKADIREVDTVGDRRIIRGVIPLAETFGYVDTLRSLTKGRGSISLEPESYDDMDKPPTGFVL